MSKTTFQHRLGLRLTARLLLMIFVLFFALLAALYLLLWGLNQIPALSEVEIIRKLGSRYILTVGISFLGSVILSLLIQRRQMLHYLSELSAQIGGLDKSGESEPLPAVLRETEQEINAFKTALREQQAIARDAEQRKNDLVVYLAHDLKTPIASILGYLSLLRDERQLSEEAYSRYVEVVYRNAERLDELIDEFFEITRFNLSHIELSRRQIDFSRLLEQLVFEFQPMLAEKALTLRSEIPAGLTLTCDPERISRVFENLLRNAVHYSFPDSEITLCAERGQEQLTITVQNHGSTIPPEKLERIFEQFYRLDASRSTHTGGAGLGLAISKQIVELHGGTITAESENEQIKFTVSLPLK